MIDSLIKKQVEIEHASREKNRHRDTYTQKNIQTEQVIYLKGMTRRNIVKGLF